MLLTAQDTAASLTETNPCIGSWFVTRAQTSVILSIEPGGGALYMFIENGSFSIGRREWKEMPGGILVEGIPRFRMWAPKRKGERIRAEMEELAKGVEVSKGFATFPLSFFMAQATLRSSTQRPEVMNRPLPDGWNDPTLKPEWDQTAGKPRPLER